MNNKNFDTKTKYVKTSLALVGIVVNLETAYLIRITLEKLEAKGGGFSVGDATNIQNEAEKYFKSLESEEKIMTKEDLKNFAIHCETEEEAIKCCELADSLGWRFMSGNRFTESDVLDLSKKDICYNFYSGQYCDIDYYKSEGYTIKSAQWFIDNFTPKTNKS